MIRFFTLTLSLVLLWTGEVTLSQQPPAQKPSAAQAQKKEEPIDFQKARALRQKQQKGEKLTTEEEAYLRRAMAARQGNKPDDAPAPQVRDHIGQKPLTEMTAEDRYKGEDGGLYGGGSNTPPEAHRKAAEAELARTQPLNAEGKPDANAKIVFVSISMSNATQEFSIFKRAADSDPDKSSRLTIVDCAQGGQAMAEWVPPNGGPWQEASRRITAAGVTPQQVQVAWIKLANKMPRGDLEEHGRKLQKDTELVIQNAMAKFPNLRIVYLASRIYGGYSAGALNPEPYAYESGLVARWLIQDQIRGKPELNYDPDKGPVKAPLLLWGAYLWADGTTPRKTDQLVWKREDLREDGTHPSDSGKRKVSDLLLTFFKNDPLARSWFVK